MIPVSLGAALPAKEMDWPWPNPDWPRATPAEVGLDEAKLAQARDYALTGGGSAGRHEEARAVAAAALSQGSDETIKKCLGFEIRLADQRDTRVCRIADALKDTFAAYLHDPPSKALDIATHGERSDAAFHRAGFLDTEIGNYFAHADHTGAAADRLPFPRLQSSGLRCAFDGVRNAFRHPLDGQPLPFHTEFKSAEQGIEGEESVQPLLAAESLDAMPDDSLRWRARFFAHWRLWPKHAIEKDYRLALLPADTRIPDHSIWTHMQVVSALDGCVGDDKTWQPAFLKFQLGPVQDFIAAARSIRDLWSGSYLLSWLVAAGMKALSAEVGPDAVIFPNLRGQPLFDLHWREELWGKVKIGGRTVWESLGCGSAHSGPHRPVPDRRIH